MSKIADFNNYVKNKNIQMPAGTLYDMNKQIIPVCISAPVWIPPALFPHGGWYVQSLYILCPGMSVCRCHLQQADRTPSRRHGVPFFRRSPSRR